MTNLEPATPSGHDTLAHQVANTDYVQFRVPNPKVHAVIVRTRGGEASYWSRTATGAFSATGTAHNTIPGGESFVIPLTSPSDPTERDDTFSLSHSVGTGFFEFELLPIGWEAWV